MKEQGAQEPIRLEIGATAEPRTCGSCFKFERTEPWNGWAAGYCLFQLPPQYKRRQNDVEGKPWDVVRDTHTCDLYQNSGKTYIVSKLVKP